MLCSLHKGMSRLEILEARYGAVGSDKDMVDVTDNVKKAVWPSGEGVSIMVSPSNLGVKDPAPQSQKFLKVRYRINGGTEVKTDTPDAATFSVTVPGTSPMSSLGYTASTYGVLLSSAWSAALVFILVVATGFAYQLGLAGYASWIFLVALTLMFPYVGIAAIVVFVMVHTAINGKFVAFQQPSMLQRGLASVKSAFSNARSGIANLLRPKV